MLVYGNTTKDEFHYRTAQYETRLARTDEGSVRWCERCAPFLFKGGAAYSISGRLYFKFSNPNSANLSIIGKVFTPIFVNRYSTLGGISGYDFLDTSLFSTKEFKA